MLNNRLYAEVKTEPGKTDADLLCKHLIDRKTQKNMVFKFYLECRLAEVIFILGGKESQNFTPCFTNEFWGVDLLNLLTWKSVSCLISWLCESNIQSNFNQSLSSTKIDLVLYNSSKEKTKLTLKFIPLISLHELSHCI